MATSAWLCRRWQAGLLARLRQTRMDPGGGAGPADLGAAQAPAGNVARAPRYAGVARPPATAM